MKEILPRSGVYAFGNLLASYIEKSDLISQFPNFIELLVEVLSLANSVA